jgi:hypothetical protein
MRPAPDRRPGRVVAMLTGAFAFLGLRRYDLLMP